MNPTNSFFLFTCLLHVQFTGLRPVPDEAYTHTLQYVYTARRRGPSPPELTAAALLDGEQFVFNDTRVTANWTKKMENESVWRSLMEDMSGSRDILESVFTKAAGVHTLQWTYGCDRYENGTAIGSSRFGYDGEEFFSLDLNSGSWTAANNEAQDVINQWDPKGDQAKHWKIYLENSCIHQLMMFVSYGREFLQRKVPPDARVFLKHSSSPPEVVCHATGFFPKAVRISWQKDGEEVQEDVELRETLPNQDGSFQKRSVLKVPAEDLQKHNYTCIIQHSSLREKKIIPVPKDGELTTKLGATGIFFIVVGVLVVLFAIGYVIFVRRKKFSCERRKRKFSGDPSSSTSSEPTVYLHPAALRERREIIEMESLVNKDLDVTTVPERFGPSTRTDSVHRSAPPSV